MAILAPLLILLLFGIIEFGWAIGQQLDVRSKAREATRMSIVAATQAEVRARVCGNDLARAANLLIVRRTNTDGPDAGSTINDPGDTTTIDITFRLQQITGMFSAFWPTTTISSQVVGRIEQPPNATWTNGSTIVLCS